MKRFIQISAVALIWSALCTAFEPNQIRNLMLEVPAGWNLTQSAFSNDVHIRLFTNGSDLVAFYAKDGALLDMRQMFAAQSTVMEEGKQESHSALNLQTLLARKARAYPARGTYFVKAFSSQHKGVLYYGYSRSTDQSAAISNANLFLSSISVPLRSLTDSTYTGKKYYFGWGAAMSGDPSLLQNEVKYDVKHTQDIFTKSIGGDYAGTQFIGSSQATGSSIRSQWTKLKGQMTKEDMYVQYSSGHGSPQGLAVGVSYSEMRDYALTFPVKETIIFTMACYSGKLVDAFNNKQSVWKDWQAQGKTLFVMASSSGSETSSTGPGTDSGEPGGPNGSAGSAFGHALWKALVGYSDGYVDGVKDGFIALGEISDFTTWKTNEVGGHTPVFTGAYHTALIMNKVPSRALLAKFEGKGTEGLSDDQIMERIRALDEELRVQKE